MTTTTQATEKTGDLHMIRGEINVPDFRRWMGGKRLLDQDHAMHCLLAECFGDLAPKPFRLITPRGSSTGILYGYGLSDAGPLRESASVCADPLQSRVIPADKLDSKPMPTLWRRGQQLGFETRIRPVVRRSRNADIHPTKECDAFYWEAVQHPKGEMKRSREQVYSVWLSDQLDRRGGASLDLERTKLISFQRTRAFRKTHARHTEGPDAVVRGVVTITNPDGFAALLAKGIGRHRAYGYGMLLLRPIGKTG